MVFLNCAFINGTSEIHMNHSVVLKTYSGSEVVKAQVFTVALVWAVGGGTLNMQESTP